MRRGRSRINSCLALCLTVTMLGCGSMEVEHTDSQTSEIAPTERREHAQTVNDSKDSEAQQDVQIESSSAKSGTRETEGEKLFFSLAGESAVAALPEEVQQQIADINMGKTLAEVIDLEGLEDYYALVATYTVVGKAEESGEEITGTGKLTLYIPNLLEGLRDVSMLFYDKAEGKWEILPVERMDTEDRTVSVTLTGSGVLTVIYRRQDEQKDEGNTDENS